MKYVLEDLLRVRRLREDTAASALARQRRRADEAERHVAQCKKELIEYVQWRIGREEAIYQEIMQQMIHRRDLDDLKSQIQVLRSNELPYKEKVLEAEKALAEVRKALEQAHAAHRLAMKKREKLDEHKKIWMEQAAKEEEYSAEKELEDFRTRQVDKTDEEGVQEYEYA